MGPEVTVIQAMAGTAGTQENYKRKEVWLSVRVSAKGDAIHSNLHRPLAKRTDYRFRKGSAQTKKSSSIMVAREMMNAELAEGS